MKIVIVGTGYVGLVSGACLAELGHQVICVDQNPERIDDLSRLEMPIFEPGLSELVESNVALRRLSFSCDMPRLDKTVNAVFLAVGTPPSPVDHSADLSAVFAAAMEIAASAEAPLTIITKSTVPVGTGDRIQRHLAAMRPDIDFSVASNPEFLREGNAISDFMHPDRVVIGADDARSAACLHDIYAPLASAGFPVVRMSRRSAEVVKYASNAFLAAKIAFVNEIADFCEATGADIGDVAPAMGLDARIGNAFLSCGPGYGGSCFPKDTEALLASAHAAGVQMRLVEGTVAANSARRRAMARKVEAAAGGSLAGRTVALLGLTFKARTDDMRDSPSLSLIPCLQAAGATIRTFDPEGMDNARRILGPDIIFTTDAYDCARAADVLVVMTEWPEFANLDFHRLASHMRGHAVVDLRNLLSARDVNAAGLDYQSLGRKGNAASPALMPPVQVSDPFVELAPVSVLVAKSSLGRKRRGMNGHSHGLAG